MRGARHRNPRGRRAIRPRGLIHSRELHYRLDESSFGNLAGMYPRRLLMAEARRMGIPILPLDVNASTDEYLVERTDDGMKTIRLSIRDVHGITGAETEHILAGQPYRSVSDLYIRAAPSRRLIERLATVGALDSLTVHEGVPHSRGDVIAYVRHLTTQRHRPGRTEHENQLPLYVDDTIPTGTPDPTSQERVRAELGVLFTEISEHVIESYRPLLDEIGVTRAADLLSV